MLDKRKPKVDDEVVVWHDGELKAGKVIKVEDITPGHYTEGLSFIFYVSTKRKNRNPYFSEKYFDCVLTGNSFTLHPMTDANINWAPVKNVGSEAFFFYTKKEYEMWLRNEYKYHMEVGKGKFEHYKDLLESDLNIKISECI